MVLSGLLRLWNLLFPSRIPFSISWWRAGSVFNFLLGFALFARFDFGLELVLFLLVDLEVRVGTLVIEDVLDFCEFFVACVSALIDALELFRDLFKWSLLFTRVGSEVMDPPLEAGVVMVRPIMWG